MTVQVDLSRPYEPLHVTMEEWLRIAPSQVWIEDLIFSHGTVFICQLLNGGAPNPTGDEFPHVVIHQGKSYLVDGHHRVVRWAVSGRRTVMARVLERDLHGEH